MPSLSTATAVAGGFYRGESAVALGTFYRPNEETMFSIGTTIGNGDSMVNVGASFKFGKGKEGRKLREEYKNAPISTVYVLEREVSTLKVENESLKSNVTELNAQVEELKRQVAALVAK